MNVLTPRTDSARRKRAAAFATRKVESPLWPQRLTPTEAETHSRMRDRAVRQLQDSLTNVLSSAESLRWHQASASARSIKDRASLSSRDWRVALMEKKLKSEQESGTNSFSLALKEAREKEGVTEAIKKLDSCTGSQHRPGSTSYDAKRNTPSDNYFNKSNLFAFFQKKDHQRGEDEKSYASYRFSSRKSTERSTNEMFQTYTKAKISFSNEEKNVTFDKKFTEKALPITINKQKDLAEIIKEQSKEIAKKETHTQKPKEETIVTPKNPPPIISKAKAVEDLTMRFKLDQTEIEIEAHSTRLAGLKDLLASTRQHCDAGIRLRQKEIALQQDAHRRRVAALEGQLLLEEKYFSRLLSLGLSHFS